MRANCNIVPGDFCGGNIEGGTWHQVDADVSADAQTGTAAPAASDAQAEVN